MLPSCPFKLGALPKHKDRGEPEKVEEATGAGFVSAAHGAAEINDTLAAAREAFRA